MSTQTKFSIGDEVRVTSCGSDGVNAFTGAPVGMSGRVSYVEAHADKLPWPYRVELEGKAAELFYPTYFAEAELELLHGITGTEWGVRSPTGDHPAVDMEAAQNAAASFHRWGHEASAIWRGVTEWQVKE